MIKLGLTSERKKYLVDTIARNVVELDLTDPVRFMLQVYQPFPIFGKLAFISLFPWAPFFGKTVTNIVEMGLESDQNISLILDRIEELEMEYELTPKLHHPTRPSLISRIISKLFNRSN